MLVDDVDEEVYMFGIGLPELMLIMVLALLVLGPQRLPEVARLVGRAYAQLRRASEEFQNTIRQDIAAIERQEDANRNKAVARELGERLADLEEVQTTIQEPDVHG
jgi:sec-independent protein translocase protein TatA